MNFLLICLQFFKKLVFSKSLRGSLVYDIYFKRILWFLFQFQIWRYIQFARFGPPEKLAAETWSRRGHFLSELCKKKFFCTLTYTWLKTEKENSIAFTLFSKNVPEIVLFFWRAWWPYPLKRILGFICVALARIVCIYIYIWCVFAYIV